MSFGPQNEQESYRLIITRRGATDLLLATNDPVARFPRIYVRSSERLASQVRERARDIFGLDAYCLFVPQLPSTQDTTSAVKYAVMESVEQNSSPPAGLAWVPIASAFRENILSDDDCCQLRTSLENLAHYLTEPDRSPFARPGWIHEVIQWTQDQIRPLEIQLTGAFEQFNAGPSFSLLRFETSGRAVWFKATGEPKLHELSVTQTLARLFPSEVPKILAVHRGWNAWLSQECPGTTLDACTTVSAWTRAAQTLAGLEIASIGKRSELLECGCRDLTLSTLVRQVDPFLIRMSDRMALQQKQPPAILSNADVEFLRGELKYACSELWELDLPDVLGHIDFNPGNIMVSPERCTFLDWAEASIGSPFLTLAYLREHSLRSRMCDEETQDQISAAYLESWRSLICPSDLVRGMTLSSIVAVFGYALALEDRKASGPFESPALAGFLRSLARRMHREALGLRTKGELCRR
jgi:Phosphotransferase enzyme family